MASGDITLYDLFLKGQVNGDHAVDFDSDTLKVALVTSSYAANFATDEFWSTPSADEVSGTGYTAGGSTLASAAITLASDVVKFDASDVTFSQNAAGFSTARYAIIYKSTGTNSTSPLIAQLDLGADKGNTGGDLVLSFNASGIINWSKS